MLVGDIQRNFVDAVLQSHQAIRENSLPLESQKRHVLLDPRVHHQRSFLADLEMLPVSDDADLRLVLLVGDEHARLGGDSVAKAVPPRRPQDVRPALDEADVDRAGARFLFRGEALLCDLHLAPALARGFPSQNNQLHLTGDGFSIQVLCAHRYIELLLGEIDVPYRRDRCREAPNREINRLRDPNVLVGHAGGELKRSLFRKLCCLEGDLDATFLVGRAAEMSPVRQPVLDLLPHHRLPVVVHGDDFRFDLFPSEIDLSVELDAQLHLLQLVLLDAKAACKSRTRLPFGRMNTKPIPPHRSELIEVKIGMEAPELRKRNLLRPQNPPLRIHNLQYVLLPFLEPVSVVLDRANDATDVHFLTRAICRTVGVDVPLRRKSARETQPRKPHQIRGEVAIARRENANVVQAFQLVELLSENAVAIRLPLAHDFLPVGDVNLHSCKRLLLRHVLREDENAFPRGLDDDVEVALQNERRRLVILLVGDIDRVCARLLERQFYLLLDWLVASVIFDLHLPHLVGGDKPDVKVLDAPNEMNLAEVVHEVYPIRLHRQLLDIANLNLDLRLLVVAERSLGEDGQLLSFHPSDSLFRLRLPVAPRDFLIFINGFLQLFLLLLENLPDRELGVRSLLAARKLAYKLPPLRHSIIPFLLLEMALPDRVHNRGEPPVQRMPREEILKRPPRLRILLLLQ